LGEKVEIGSPSGASSRSMLALQTIFGGESGDRNDIQRSDVSFGASSIFQTCLI
jgi:hypothetical protein